MINIQLTNESIKSVETLVASKIEQLSYVASPTARTEIAKAVFTVTSKKFLDDLAAIARSDPQRYHHLYEWGAIGNNTEKLFLMERVRVQYGDLMINIKPLQSHKPVPINPLLLQPGSTGRVVTSRSVFRNKMEIMEAGTPVHIQTRHTIVFPGSSGLVFVPAGKIIDIANPGGPKTVHALGNFANTWFASKASIAVKQSGLIRAIGTNVARVVDQKGSTVAKVYETIRKTSSDYSKEITVR